VKSKNFSREETIINTWESHQVVETFHEMLVNDEILKNSEKFLLDSSNRSLTFRKETRQVLTCIS